MEVERRVQLEYQTERELIRGVEILGCIEYILEVRGLMGLEKPFE